MNILIESSLETANIGDLLYQLVLSQQATVKLFSDSNQPVPKGVSFQIGLRGPSTQER